MIQALSGIKITPKGTRNISRWAFLLVNGSFPSSSFAGAWVYNAGVDVGYSEHPTTIKLGLVLEISGKTQQQTNATFLVTDDDLDCGGGSGNDERLYDIDCNGIVFKDLILYEYEISIENNAKILTVTFKDYSVILDKIYVGLLKRQGNLYTHTAHSQLVFNVRCPDCILAGDSFTQQGIVYRDIAFCSYVGINGNTYDNFVNINPTLDIFSQWTALFSTSVFPDNFDLNGGY